MCLEGISCDADDSQYKVPPGEEEPIALHALVGGKEHPDFQNCE